MGQHFWPKSSSQIINMKKLHFLSHRPWFISLQKFSATWIFRQHFLRKFKHFRKNSTPSCLKILENGFLAIWIFRINFHYLSHCCLSTCAERKLFPKKKTFNSRIKSEKIYFVISVSQINCTARIIRLEKTGLCFES